MPANLVEQLLREGLRSYAGSSNTGGNLSGFGSAASTGATLRRFVQALDGSHGTPGLRNPLNYPVRPRGVGKVGPVVGTKVNSAGDTVQTVTKNKKRKKKTKKNPMKRLKKTVARLAKSLPPRSIQKQVNYKVVQPAASPNQVTYGEIVISTSAEIEGMLNSISIYNISAPQTPLVTNTTLVTQPIKWRVETYSKFTARNNWTYPTDIKLYVVECIARTDTSPATILNTSTNYTKQVVSGMTIAETDPCWYPSDVPTFGDFYKIVKSYDFRLGVGEECTQDFSRTYSYDPESHDIEAATYEPPVTHHWMIRLMGVVCHDTSDPALVGLGSAKLDCLCKIVKKIRSYSLGGLKTLEYVNGMGAIVTPIEKQEDLE